MTEVKASALGKFLTADIRFIYLIVFLLIVIGAAVRVAPSGLISPFTLRTFNTISNLQPGDKVLYQAFFRGVTYPEVWAAQEIVFTHLVERGAVIIIWASTTETIPIVEMQMNVYWGPDWQTSPDYGKKFVYLGYLPHSSSAVYSASKDFKKLFPRDYKGTSLNDLPATKDIKDASSFKLVFSGIASYARIFSGYFTVPYGVMTIAVADVGTVAPAIDYWAAGILDIIAGAKLGAEYEILVQRPGTNQRFMSSVFLVATFVFIGMVVNNVEYLRRRSRTTERGSG